MTCEAFRKELRRLIGDSWDAPGLEISDEMREHTETCVACRVRLDAAVALHGPDPGTLTASADLAERTMRRIAEVPFGRVGGQRSRVIPLLAAAALLVFVTAAVTIAIVGPRARSTVEVHLVLSAPGATSVAVVGDWNGWDLGAQELRDDDGDGLWELRFRVDPGRDYEYQFVVDGSTWRSDPLAALQVDDGFGGTNSVLDI